jgi:alginate O-acetyltransferase complex protein AlgI
MVFSSVGFLFLYLPTAAFLYWLAPPRWKNVVLAALSIVFYALGEPRFVFLMLFSVLLNFRFAIAIERCTDLRQKRALLAAATGINIGTLALFKYADFIFGNINLVLRPLGKSIDGFSSVAVPLGISFYTFHAISYLIDVYRGNARPNSSLIQYSLYIMLFPQLVAGPIVRYKDIYQQLPERKVTAADVSDGILRFTIGLAKKVLIADPLGAIADAGFSSPASELAAADAWLYLVSYTLQIYFDFSGYSDMAIGLARLFGFRFPENFNYPYTARSVQEFWRRWHISLSTWFRDYVYVPLGGNRRGQLRTLCNLWIVFLMAGLWHGAHWKFVAWGAIHGLFLTLERAREYPVFHLINYN